MTTTTTATHITSQARTCCCGGWQQQLALEVEATVEVVEVVEKEETKQEEVVSGRPSTTAPWWPLGWSRRPQARQGMNWRTRWVVLR
jgi:hypothetical protein